MSSKLTTARRLVVQITLALAAGSSVQLVDAAGVAPSVRAEAARSGSVDALIVLGAKAPKNFLRTDGSYLERRRALVDTLRATADVSQVEVRRWLDEQGISYRPFWIVNMLQATLTPAQLDALAARSDVARIESNAGIALQRPLDEPLGPVAPNAVLATEWGVNKVRAPMVWAAGYNGQGIVVAGQDTGVRWTHAAIKAKYRGWDGTVADHNYNWHDAVHGTGNGTCAGDRQIPCDDNGHGSHTVGTVLGDDGGTNQVGVAPGAKWIGCRNMNAGNGTPALYNECAEFFLAPTDLTGANADPDRAPDVVTNSWGCPASEGCTAGDEVREAIENLVEGGIVFVAAAGNDGSACSTIGDAPAIYDASFTIGSMTSTDTMSSFSGRGPVVGLTGTKPDVIAPGSSVRSITNGSDSAYASLSGTSMATPHVAGVVALIMSVDPSLRGNPARVEQILRDTAIPLTTSTQVCGGIPATTFPNPVQGYGRVDAWNAFLVAEKIFASGYD